MVSSNPTYPSNSISPELAEYRAALKRQGLDRAAHNRRMLAKHWPEQYGRQVRELSARLAPGGGGAGKVELTERVRWEIRRSRKANDGEDN